MSFSKLLYTPTANQACANNLFGGVIWRCCEVDQPDHDRRVPCTKLTKIVSRAIFYFHQAIFHRHINFNLRWVVLEFTDRSRNLMSTQTHLLCHGSWFYLVQFFQDFPPAEQVRSENLRLLLSNFVKIIKCIYQNSTLFLVRLSPRSDRSTAMNLLLQAAAFVMTHTSHISTFDAGLLDSMLEEIKPKQLGSKFPTVTGRSFHHTIPGQTTYFYHTFQHCPHLVEDGCPDCRIAHTRHMAQMKRFLIDTHVTIPSGAP